MDSTIITDKDGRHLNIDVSGSLPVIQTTHKHSHDGEMFEGAHRIDSLVVDANIDVIVEIPQNIRLHCEVLVAVGGDCDVQLYRNPEYTPGSGTLITMYNLNDYIDGAKPFISVLRGNPVVTNVGTPISPLYYVTAGDKKSIGSIEGFNERILNNNTNYLFRATNKSAAAIKAQILILTYEHVVQYYEA